MLALTTTLVLTRMLASFGCDEPSETVRVMHGTAPVVVVIAHAGTKTPVSCATREPVPRRVCAPEHDLLCQSGPCRLGGDIKLKDVGDAFAAHLGACLGAAPTVVFTSVKRAHYDGSRDANDPFSPSCAIASDDVKPYWQAFVDALDAATARAHAIGGERALLIDVHTYGGSDVAPPPALILGTGRPFGATLPRASAAAGDAALLEALMGGSGLRVDLETSFARSFPAVNVYPLIAADAELEEMMSGRNIITRASRTIDALQLEVSAKVRDEPELAAYLAADAICRAFAPRVAPR